MDFDEVADELYGIPPEEFIATRRAREEQARAEGDRVLAKSISVLPKPSLAAWAVNVLVRAHRDEIEGLVELGGLLREAQENLAGDQLRALSVQRNQLLAALSRQVMALTRELGHPVSSGVTGQVEETLRAAMADTEAGEAVLSGRLTAPLSYSGLGTGQRPDLRVVRPPAQDRSGPAPARKAQATEKQATEKQATKDGSRTPAEQRRRAAEERRRREEEAARREAEERRRRELAEAQQAADEATEAADEAAAAAEAEQVRLEEVDARHERLQARVDELMDELARTREEVTTANAQLSRAQRRRQAAGRRAAEAATTRDRALQRLEDLRREG